MGKGKGQPYTFVYPAAKGRVLIEMSRNKYGLIVLNGC